METEKHRVFVSFHSDDQFYRDKFDELYRDHFISVSVDEGDIDPNSEDEYIKHAIQQGHLEHCSVAFVLYGAKTKERKHVDWEMWGALSKKVGGHKGLVVMLLPTFPAVPYDGAGRYDPSRIYPYLHPRTAANLESGYADLYYWPGHLSDYPGVRQVSMPNIIECAFNKRDTHNHLIDNSHPQYKRNLGL